MSALPNMIKELRERKLWPVALVLIVALVAVPLLLSKRAPTTLIKPPTGGLPYSSGTTLPAISVTTKLVHSRLAGRGRDPFTPQHVATTSTTSAGPSTATSLTPSAATAAAAAGGSTAAIGATGTTGAGGGGGATVTPATTSPTPGSAPSPSPAPTPAPSRPSPATPIVKPMAPAGLTATESYRVSLAVTNAAGGLDTIDPLERLSVLPGAQQPMVVELGVVKGGDRVLFVVEPGTVVSGPGVCTPGPIDCEIVSLAPGQTEGLSTQTGTGSTPVALFAVNDVSVDHYPSSAAAGKARREASEAGRRLLANSPLSAVSLFQYDPSVGAVIDLRNLTVGDN